MLGTLAVGADDEEDGCCCCCGGGCCCGGSSGGGMNADAPRPPGAAWDDAGAEVVVELTVAVADPSDEAPLVSSVEPSGERLPEMPPRCRRARLFFRGEPPEPMWKPEPTSRFSFAHVCGTSSDSVSDLPMALICSDPANDARAWRGRREKGGPTVVGVCV